MAKKKVEEQVNEEIDLTKKETKKIKEELVHDLKEDIKTTVKEELPKIVEETYEETIKPIITEDVTKEAKKRVEIEEKKIIRSKNFALFRKNIIILLLVITNLYLIYGWVSEYYDITIDKNGIKIKEIMNDNKEVIEDNKIQETEKDEETEEIIKDLAYYQQNYSYLINDLKLNYLNNPMNYYLYNNNLNVKDIRNDVKLNIVYSLIKDEDISIVENKIMIPNDKMEIAFKKIFGNIEYKKETFIADCYRFIYNEENGFYEAINSICNNSDYETIEVITEAYEEEKTLIMKTSVAVYDKISLNLYKTNDLINPVIGNIDFKTFNILEHQDVFDSYKYTFKLNENNEYIFDSIEKIGK